MRERAERTAPGRRSAVRREAPAGVLAAALAALLAASAQANPDFTRLSSKCVETATGCDPSAPLNPGDPVTFQVRIANTGTAAAENVNIEDDLILGPACWLSEITSATCSGPPPCVTCWVEVITPGMWFKANTARMEPGCVLDIVINARINPISSGSCCNEAVVDWTGPPPGGTYTTPSACIELPGSCAADARIDAATTTVCTGETLTLDGSGSTLTDCSGSAVYEWFRDGAPYDTGATTTVQESVAGSYEYRLQLTCSGDPACTSSATQVIEVQDCPACTATAAIAAPPGDGCAGVPLDLDAGGSTVSSCSGATEFQWLRDAVPVPPPAGTMPVYTADEPVAGTYLYTVEVSCATQPGCVDSTDLVVDFLAAVTPGEVGNTVLGRRLLADVDLVWTDPQPHAASWNVYRSTDRTVLGTPASAVAESYLDAGAVAYPPYLYFYRVRAVSCSGDVGP